jgi:hypothetical protein
LKTNCEQAQKYRELVVTNPDFAKERDFLQEKCAILFISPLAILEFCATMMVHSKWRCISWLIRLLLPA